MEPFLELPAWRGQGDEAELELAVAAGECWRLSAPEPRAVCLAAQQLRADYHRLQSTLLLPQGQRLLHLHRPRLKAKTRGLAARWYPAVEVGASVVAVGVERAEAQQSVVVGELAVWAASCAACVRTCVGVVVSWVDEAPAMETHTCVQTPACVAVPAPCALDGPCVGRVEVRMAMQVGGHRVLVVGKAWRLVWAGAWGVQVGRQAVGVGGYAAAV